MRLGRAGEQGGGQAGREPALELAASQTHWFRLADGRIVWHAANRDDLGQARQLGWVPPSPAFLLRSALARRRLRRAAA